MDMSVSGALSTYAYQNTLTQTGSASQALTQAMAAGQSQAAEAGALLASAGQVDPISALSGGSNSQTLVSLAYSSSAASGNGPEAVQAMLATLGGGASALLPTSDGLPVSTAALSPTTTEALARYAYDQSQNPAHTAAQAAAAGQQSLLSSGLNLLG